MILAELDRVTKRFGAVTALAEASFRVAPAEVVALLGPNGAGKSTAINILLGLRRPDRGRAVLFGGDPRLPSSRRGLGMTPQETLFPQTLRPHELIDLVRAHYAASPCAAATIARFGLGALRTRQVGGLSTGQRRLVGVALAFAGAPRLVVLDEPTAGLDGDARRTVWQAVRHQVQDGGAVLLTTHHLDEAEALASRVVLVDRGVVVADSSVAELKRSAGRTRVSFRAHGAKPVAGSVRDGDFVRILTRDGGATVAALVRDGVALDDLEVRPATLEEAIAAIGGGGA